MELFLDDYTDPEGPTSLRQKEKNPVAKRLKDISKLLEIDRDLHAPPPVRFNWGPMEFTAVIEKLGRKVTMFHPDGTPARATLSVNFKEYRTLRQQLEDPRRESADKTKRRVVVGKRQPVGDRRERIRRSERVGPYRRSKRSRRSARHRAGRLADRCRQLRIQMELATLSSRYGNFYAPAFAVRVGRDDLMRDLLARGEPGRGRPGARRGRAVHVSPWSNSLQPEDRTFMTGRGRKVLDLLKFGAEVEICIGYGDAKSVPAIASGLITEITTNFPGVRNAGAGDRRLRPRLSADDRQELAHLDQGARQRRSARDRELPQSQRQHRNDQGTARADRAEPGKRLGIPEEARRSQSLRAVRRRAHARCISASRTTRRPRWSGSHGAKACCQLQAGGESRRPDLEGRGLRLGSEDEGKDRRCRAAPARSPARRQAARARASTSRPS